MKRGTKTAIVGSVCAAAATGVIFIPGIAGAQPNTSASPASSGSQPTPAALACDRGPWGWRVEGDPVDFGAGERGGDYLWHDQNGFHLAVTHKNDNRVVYTGEIVSPTPMRIDPVHLEKGDVAELSADQRTLTFAFADYGHIDGVNFHTDCAATITVADLNAGNAPLTADRVYLGKFEIHPEQVPFALHRRAG